MLLLLIAIVPIGIVMEWDERSGVALPEWELKWGSSNIQDVEEAASAPDEDWIKQTASSSRPLTNEGMTGAWIRFTLPPTAANSALLIDKVYGNMLKAYKNNVLIYDSADMVNYNGSKVLIPLSAEDKSGQLYLWSSGGSKGSGIEGGIRVGNYDKLLAHYVKQDLIDLIIGAALIFMAVALLMCLLFFRLEFFSGGLWLVFVIASFGMLLITYSPFCSSSCTAMTNGLRFVLIWLYSRCCRHLPCILNGYSDVEKACGWSGFVIFNWFIRDSVSAFCC